MSKQEMWVIVKPIDSREMEYEFDWWYELKQIRQDEKAHWIHMITKLVSQVTTKMLSYIKLIMKKREGTFHDEHEEMFNMS